MELKGMRKVTLWWEVTGGTMIRKLFLQQKKQGLTHTRNTAPPLRQSSNLARTLRPQKTGLQAKAPARRKTQTWAAAS
jgi:hypothetical protein